jgi:hypothetical protein
MQALPLPTTPEMLLVVAKRIRAAVLAAKLGASFEELLNEEDFLTPQDRECWKAFAGALLRAIDQLPLRDTVQ